MELNIAETKIQEVLIVRLNGRLDATSSSSLETKLQSHIAKKEKRILLDFANVTYLSSAGMRLLLAMTKKMQGQGGVFGIFSVEVGVMEIIKMAGFERILHLYSSEAEALKAAQKSV